MSAAETYPERRFHRNADKALIGGVCAGIADHLGFNLRVTRILAFIAFLMAMPVAVIAYFAVVFLVPSVSSHRDGRRWRMCGRRRSKERHRQSQERAGVAGSTDTIAVEIDARCRDMDERLARLEQHVTSQRFQLEQEFRNL